MSHRLPIRRALLVLACIFGVFGIALRAQSPAGALLGKLTDTHSAPLAEATVTLRNLATGTTSQTVTAKNGSYRFLNLAPGEYSLAAVVPSLGQGSIAGILIAPSHLTRVQAALVMQLPPPPDLPDIALHSLDPITPAVTSTIANEDLASLPLATRNWQAFAAITPAGNPVPQSNASGQLPGQSDADSGPASESLSLGAGDLDTLDAMIDEVPATPAFRTPSQSPALPSLGESAIQSVTAQTGNPPASQPATPAGSIQVTTSHGQNGFHGQAFYLNRQNLFNAQNPFTQIIEETSPANGPATAIFDTRPYTPPSSRQTFGIGIGRQIKRDKLFWFAALDGILANDAAVATVRHPDDFFSPPSTAELQMLAARIEPTNLQSSAACPAGSLPPAQVEEQAAACYSGFLQQMNSLLGPVSRSLTQGQLFARLDWQLTERHHLAAESGYAAQHAPAGALLRTSETYGSHSFGDSRANELFALAKLDSFLTANLLSTAALEFRRRVLNDTPQSLPQTGLEAALLPYTLGQLPQIVADSRDGFVLGTPTRLGKGNDPLETSFIADETISWVHGNHLLKAGATFDHVADAVDTVSNQNGAYAYSDLLNFISDTAVIETFGLAGYDPQGHQHNCDATGRVYNRINPGGEPATIGGLGNLPCYAWFSQRIGPANWHLSTNDLAAFHSDQWQPFHNLTLSAGLRVQHQQLPPPIAAVQNSDLSSLARLPSTGYNFAPRFGLAWSPFRSSRTLVRAGAGLYYGRIDSSSLLAALTQTGSLNGDLNFFFRPTDNGAPLFPTAFPTPPAFAVKPGAVFFAPRFKNQEIDQAVVSIEQQLPAHWIVAVSAIASLGRRLPISVDSNLDPQQGPGKITYAVEDPTHSGPIKTQQITVPFYTARYTTEHYSNYQQLSAIESRANSTYQAEMIKLIRTGGRGLSLRAHYLYAHATDWNPNETGNVAGSDLLDPADFHLEYGTSNLDIRHSATATVIYATPFKLRDWAGVLANGWALAAVGQYRSGLPFSMRTSGSIPGFYDDKLALIQGVAPGINGSGGDNRLYAIGRNTFRYPATWIADARLSKRFHLPQGRELELLAESFNLFNHQNVTLLETTGYILRRGTTSGDLPTLNFLDGLTAKGTPSVTPEFGKPLDVNATNYYRPRQFQIGLRTRF